MLPLVQKPVFARQVFAENLKSEFMMIQQALTRFSYVSIDTEFPGTIFKADRSFLPAAPPSYLYNIMKSNVDALNIIQIGLTLSDGQGNLPDFGDLCCYVWEFNFKDFDIKQDPHDKDSIEFLKQQGIDFEENRVKGINSYDFARFAFMSGLISNKSRLIWVTYNSMYDFGFLIKIFTRQKLPNNVEMFRQQIAKVFGEKVYDIKHNFKKLGLHGSLKKVAAEMLNVDHRVVGNKHQAGYGSLLILRCFMKLNKYYEVFEGKAINATIPPALRLYGM